MNNFLITFDRATKSKIPGRAWLSRGNQRRENILFVFFYCSNFSLVSLFYYRMCACHILELGKGSMLAVMSGKNLAILLLKIKATYLFT